MSNVFDDEEFMKIEHVPYNSINWSNINPVEHKGESGTSFWQTVETGNIRVRIVEYSKGFVADHFCERGHVGLVLEGELQIKLKDRKTFQLKLGMSFLLADDKTNPHTVISDNGAKIFIID